jgi:flagellar biogenesis protein FliO
MKRMALTRSACLTLLLAGGPVWPAAAQKLGQGGGTDVSVWRVTGALIFCLLLAAGAAFALRARLRGALPPLRGQGRRLRLVESLRLSHQTDLCLIELDGRELVVASSAHGATLLLDRGVAEP